MTSHTAATARPSTKYGIRSGPVPTPRGLLATGPSPPTSPNLRRSPARLRRATPEPSDPPKGRNPPCTETSRSHNPCAPGCPRLPLRPPSRTGAQSTPANPTLIRTRPPGTSAIRRLSMPLAICASAFRVRSASSSCARPRTSPPRIRSPTFTSRSTHTHSLVRPPGRHRLKNTASLACPQPPCPPRRLVFSSHSRRLPPRHHIPWDGPRSNGRRSCNTAP